MAPLIAVVIDPGNGMASIQHIVITRKMLTYCYIMRSKVLWNLNQNKKVLLQNAFQDVCKIAAIYSDLNVLNFETSASLSCASWISAPTETNAESFWRFVWEVNAGTIVSLLTAEEMEKQACFAVTKKRSYGKYVIEMHNEERFIHYESRDIILKHKVCDITRMTTYRWYSIIKQYVGYYSRSVQHGTYCIMQYNSL